MLRVSRVVVVVVCAALALAGCSTPVTAPTTDPLSSMVAMMELGGTKYRLVTKPTPVGELPEGSAGFVDLAALLVNPDAAPDGMYHWFAHNKSVVTTAYSDKPHSMTSPVIKLARASGGAYHFDAEVTCGMAASTQTSPLSAWANQTPDDPTIVKLAPVGVDTCSKPPTEEPQKQ